MHEDILNSISEHSPEGFALFTVNESGQPEIYVKYESEIVGIALHKFITMWAQITEAQQLEVLDHLLSGSQDDKQEGDDNEA